MKYIISDTHFGHENIIEYTERPFSTIEEMNVQLIKRWNEKVSDEDVVYHLGDVCHSSGAPPEWWLDKLNGQIVVVRGNHDSGLSQNAPVPAVESCVIQHGRYQFYCEHQPVGATGWQLHGHSHNNDTFNYPLVRPATQTVNVSVELINYKPIALETIIRLLEKNKRYETIKDASKIVKG